MPPRPLNMIEEKENIFDPQSKGMDPPIVDPKNNPNQTRDFVVMPQL